MKTRMLELPSGMVVEVIDLKQNPVPPLSTMPLGIYAKRIQDPSGKNLNSEVVRPRITLGMTVGEGEVSLAVTAAGRTARRKIKTLTLPF